jgi:hypothetical protein
MKRWLAVSLVVFLVLIPMNAVFASPHLQEEMVPILATDCPGGECPDTNPDNPLIYDTVSSISYPTGGITRTNQIQCEGTGCSQVDIYITMRVVMDAAMYDAGATTYLRLGYQGSNGAVHYEYIDCGTVGIIDNCTAYVNYLLPASEISSDPDTWHINFTFWLINGSFATMSATFDYEVYLSTTPINSDACDASYQIMGEIVSDGVIEATDEDGEASTLVVGEYYRLAITGGPWNDGSNSREDTAVSFDAGSTWDETEDVAIGEGAVSIECLQNSPEDMNDLTFVFEAETVNFSIRVDDTVGAFANNTGTMEYTLYQVEYSAALTCADQFQYNGASPLASGTIQANSATGSTPLSSAQMSAAGLAVGDWIVIQTTSGSWQNNGAGAALYDIAMQNPDTTWTELSASEWSNCSDVTGNYIRAFVQLPSLALRLRINDVDGTWTSNTGSISYSIFAATYDPFPQSCEITFENAEFIESNNVSGLAGNGRLMMEDLYCDNWPEYDAGGHTCIDGLLYQPLSPEQVIAMSEAEYAFRWLMIETSNGPWYDGTTAGYEGAMDDGDGTGFFNLVDYPDATCAVEIDPLGHVRAYWPHSSAMEEYLFRVNDDDFNDNSGALTYTIYQSINQQVTDPDDELGDGVCDAGFTYDVDSAVSITINATNSTGVLLPLIESGDMFAVVSSGGPWTNDGVNSYELGISDDNGATWVEFPDYAGQLCAQEGATADHAMVWLRGAEGHRYRMRVWDEGGVYSDNAGTMTITVYSAVTDINPWNSCAADYKLTEIELTEAERAIPANLSEGILINRITSGTGFYSIEIVGGPWAAGEVESFLADVSDDGGITWQDLGTADFAECIVVTNGDTGADALYRIYFSVQGGPYRLRVAGDTSWMANTGSLEYRLYRAGIENPYNNSDIPPEWILSCYENCRRPDSLFTYVDAFGALGDVDTGNETFDNFITGAGTVLFEMIDTVRSWVTGEISNDPDAQGMTFKVPVPDLGTWVEYFRCALEQWLSWCPEHTQLLAQLQDGFLDHDPFGTFYEMRTAAVAAQGALASYDMGGGEEGTIYTPRSIIFSQEGGEGDVEPWGGVIPLLGTDSVWNGGTLDLTGGEASPYVTEYRAQCTESFTPYVGAGATTGLCFFLGMLHSLPGAIFITIGIILDVGVLFWLIKSFWVDWIKTGASA